MADAVLRFGSPQTINYTPAAGDVALGKVVQHAAAGLTCGIAARAIANNVLGALSYGGEWEVVAAGNVANYSKVYWDDSTKKVTATATNNALFGFVTNRRSAADATSGFAY